MRDWPCGRRVRLRPLTVEDQPFMDRLNANRSPYTSFERPRRRTLAEKLAAGPLVDEHGGDALVARRADDTPIGVVDWHAVYYGPRSETRSRSWMVGRELLPEYRGHGYGKEVMRLLIDWRSGSPTPTGSMAAVR
jgi:RimJ/RimL family protein N-acetyltransferase